MKRKIINVDGIALLKHMDCDFELHLKPKTPTWINGGNMFPLNFFQKLVYRFLRFNYVEGADYIDLMSKRIKDGDLRGTTNSDINLNEKNS